MKKVNTIAIVGSGLVGSMMAIFLSRKGYQVSVFEKRKDLRDPANSIGGKSINLALSNRGWAPIKKLNLEKEVKKMVIPMHGRIMHDVQGGLTTQAYGKEGEFINSISRGGLNALLMDQAEKSGASIFFNQGCKQVDFDATALTFVDASNKIHKQNFDLIIGSDGAFSAVRAALQKTDRFDYNQFYIEHGYKELSIPPAENNGFLIDKNALHIWPRKKFMLIALPNLDGSFTVTLFLPFEGDKSFSKLNSPEKIRTFFEEEFADAARLMPQLIDEFASNPTGSLVTIKCLPWVKNRTLLVGDAAHAIVPFYGQGMNAGFEDCFVLDGLIEELDHDWDKILPAFEALRKPDADAIADLALNNFIEMRDSVADPSFLLRKKIESKLNAQFPDQWIPLYSMVTFNEHIRYSDALKIGKQQKEIMNGVMKEVRNEQDIDNIDLEKIIKLKSN